MSNSKSYGVYIDSYKKHVTKTLSRGLEDWTIAIKRAIADTPPGDTLVLPNVREYGTTSTIVVNKAIKIQGGARLVSCHTGTALLFRPDDNPNFGGAGGDTERLEIDISVEKHTRNWNDESVGVHIYNSYYGVFRFPRIVDFTTSLILDAEKRDSINQGSSYNTFYIGKMENYRYGITLKSRHLSGWTTENTFYGGSLGGGYGVPSDNYHVFFDSDEMGWNNNNKFYNVSFEGHYTRCIIGSHTMNNVFYSCRYEMPYINELVNWGVSTQNNGIFNGYGLGETLLSKITDRGRYNRVSATSGYTVGYVEYYDGEFFSFIKRGEKIKPIGDKTVTPIGNSPQQVVNVTDGKIIIDLGIARDFYFIVRSDVVSISIINAPSYQRGMEFSLTFNQESSNGYSITGFPKEIVFGTRGCSLPVKRSYGTDVYSIKSTSDSRNYYAVMSQFSS